MQKSLPLITVVTVVLNAKDCIEKTIKSVINQTYENVEYIVIDGGSTDGTQETIKQYGDKISKTLSEPDKGIYDAMNKGIDLANGEWINFMNSGDYFYTNDILEGIFKDKNIQEDFIYGDTISKFYIGHYISTKFSKAPEPEVPFWKVFPCHQSSFVRTEILKANKFNTKDTIQREFADYALLLDFRYKKKLKFKRENIIVASYLGGGFSSINIFENPYFSTIKKRINKWRLTSKYVNSYKMHIYNLMLVIRSFILVTILKFMPDRLKFRIFNKFFL